ncbi:hypothetical protein GCM10027416_20270 [Okibacterium endophyticum]
MADRLVPGLIVVGIIVVALGAMWLAWRSRTAKDASIAPSAQIPAAGIHPIAAAAALYVATTRAERPLERLALAGLAYRARADVTVAEEGVVIAARGEEPVFIGASALVGSGEATWTIDRVVEKDGLVMVRWQAGDDLLDSYLRIGDQTDHRHVLDALASIRQKPSESISGESESKA